MDLIDVTLADEDVYSMPVDGFPSAMFILLQNEGLNFEAEFGSNYLS